VVKRGNLSATYGNWTLHMFRHTFATSHLRSGVNIRTLMKWSGHEDLATVQQYLDWLNAHSDEARLAVNRTFATTFVPPLALASAEG
jgi:integrase